MIKTDETAAPNDQNQPQMRTNNADKRNHRTRWTTKTNTERETTERANETTANVEQPKPKATQKTKLTPKHR